MDIHGQHEGVSLFNTRTHLEIVDRFGNLLPLRAEVAELVEQLREVRGRLDELRRSELRRQDRIDELRYQIDEIEAARLRVGEEAELARERTLLQNSARVTELVSSAYAALAAGDEAGSGAQSAIDLLGQAVAAIADLARLDTAADALLEQANDVLFRIEDLAATLREYRDALEFDPGRMEEIEERFLMLRSLQRKYGVETAAEMLRWAGTGRHGARTARPTRPSIWPISGTQETALLRSLGTKSPVSCRVNGAPRARSWSADRAVDGRSRRCRMSSSPADRAAPRRARRCLASENGTGARMACDESGVDRVEFMLSPNPGEPLKPLARIASGGEIARLLLAMKSILSTVDVVPTLVFDEVDVGVGGRAGGVVGEKLWSMTGNHQVICITHLPQVAAFADAHYTIRKLVEQGRTRSTVKPLDGTTRVDEIAEMLDGTPISPSQSEPAKTMFDRATTFKRDNKDGSFKSAKVRVSSSSKREYQGLEASFDPRNKNNPGNR